jgi:CRP/FNR family transcriptional regulator, cyclic AMP receptor protein
MISRAPLRRCGRGARAGGYPYPSVDENEDVGETVTTADFLGSLGPAAAAEFEHLGARRRFPAGATLFVEGDHAHEAFVLLSGEVKVSVVSISVREVVLDVFERGCLLGELSVIDGRPRSASLVALSPVEVLAVAAGPFNEFLDRHPQALRLLLVEVVDRLRTRVRHQMEFGTGDALGRVCARLDEIAQRHGEREGEAVVVRSPVSQADLAAWTGLSREAVVKALRALRQLGWIHSEGRTITITDPEQVRRRAAH